MGKGDKRTKRGKIFRGSYGKSRPKKKGRKTGQQAATEQR
jgi:30S ribosomal protein S31